MKPGLQGRKEAGSQDTGKWGQTSVGSRESEAPPGQWAGRGWKGLRTGLLCRGRRRGEVGPRECQGVRGLLSGNR